MFWQKKKGKVHSAIAYIKAIDMGAEGEVIALSEGDSPVINPYADGMGIFYLVDQGSHYQYVNHRELSEAGLTPEQLHQIGLDNLLNKLSETDVTAQPYGNIHAVLCGGQFEASAILIDRLWSESFRGLIQNEFAFAIAANDILAFCDSGSEQGLAELKQLIGRIYAKSSNLISDRVHILRNGKLEPMLNS